MSKLSIIKRCREILYRYDIGENINQEDSDFIISLLEFHPRKQQKKGIGIKNISIEMTEYNQRCFYIKRIDNTSTDFSFYACINKTTKLKEIMEACRYTIKDYIISVKNGVNCHAHHSEISFKEIVLLWIKNKNIENIELLGHDDNCHHLYFKDKILEEDFINFHNKLAKIVLLDKEAHIHLKKKVIQNDD